MSRRRIEALIRVGGDCDEGRLYDIVDISDIGCCLQGPDPLQKGRAIELILTLGEGEVVLTGKVVWTRPWGPRGSTFRVGCSYRAKNPESQERLRRFVAQLPGGDQTPVRR